MLRLSSCALPHANPAAFDRGSPMHRVAPWRRGAGDLALDDVASLRPLITRLWPSVSFGALALWQDTPCVSN